ncbi:MAG: hypothetical protein F4174_11250 [Acidobacteria bacterium]|nr:hypothetical protein [Acidobacteriota bacterium]
MPGWRITAFIERKAEGAVRVADISPKGFVRREHVGKSYADEGAAKLAISESFREWSSNTALSVTVAVVDIHEPVAGAPLAAASATGTASGLDD